MNTSTEECLRILVVEDEEGPAKTLKKTIEEHLGSIDIQIEQNFDKALTVIRPRSFEAVVLDLFRGDPANNDKEGQKLWEQIWRTKLVPIIVHTAGDFDLDPSIPSNNPFLKCFKKQSGSDEEVAKHLLLIKPHILALREVELEFNGVIQRTLVEISPLIWQVEADNQLRSELLTRSARRRLAAMMDLNTLTSNKQLLSWEQYIIPPLEDCLLMGDILRVRSEAAADPTAHRLVLTPSCDMVAHKGKSKVNSILVAKCKHMNEYLKLANVSEKELSKKLPRLLTEPHLGGYVPLPEYGSVLPNMAVCLRDLELIPLGNIGTANKPHVTFDRVASIDSPFREHIAWAYLQIAGRPGVPDRDLDKWTRKILESRGAS